MDVGIEYTTYNGTLLAGGPAELRTFPTSAAVHLLRGCQLFNIVSLFETPRDRGETAQGGQPWMGVGTPQSPDPAGCVCEDTRTETNT